MRKMAKGKRRKRKAVDVASSEEVSSNCSQSQDSQTPGPSNTTERYVPRFGNAFKKVRLDLTRARERRSSGSQSDVLQGDSCTQPALGDCHVADSEMVPATQPARTVYKVSEVEPDDLYESRTQPASDLNSTTSQFVPGLSLSQSNSTSPNSSDVELSETLNQVRDNKLCEVKNNGCTSNLSVSLEHSEFVKSGGSLCDELKSSKVDIEDSNIHLNHGSEPDPMNLKLLNPLCVDSDSDDDINVKSHDKAVDSNEPVSENLNHKLQGQNTENCASLEQSDVTNKSVGQPLLVNTPSQPTNDATLPNDQELPVDSAHIESLYDGDSPTKKDILCKEHHTVNVGEETDAELAMQEMMDLEVEDLEESQLSTNIAGGNATVPSVSPQGQVSKWKEVNHPTHKPGYVFNTRTNAHLNPSGGAVLKGLVQELSSINRFIMRCKKDLENARRQWTKSRQQHSYHS